MDYIERYAFKFRQAIEKALVNNEFYRIRPFNNFPIGCCNDASDLLAEYLFENGIKTKNICGTYRNGGFYDKYSHAWLETKEGIIIDITLDQFNDSSNIS